MNVQMHFRLLLIIEVNYDVRLLLRDRLQKYTSTMTIMLYLHFMIIVLTIKNTVFGDLRRRFYINHFSSDHRLAGVYICIK